MNRGITKENLLLILPPALTYDPSIMALASLDAEALAARLAEIDRVRVISNIDGLDETVLDILAKDFKVDWWDPRYSIEEKRRTLKESWRVHKILGTKAAVETAIRAIYPETRVEEWFEYEGGRPYHFKLHIDLTGVRGDDIHPWSVLDRVNFYKSLRSHLDRIKFTTKPKALNQGTYYSYFAPQFKAHGIECKQLLGSRILNQPNHPIHDQVKQYLADGYYIIALMGPGTWTTGGHFIVVWDWDDKVRINDPASTKTQRLNGDPATFRKEVRCYWLVDARAINKRSSAADDAIDKLAKLGVINSPDYWKTAAASRKVKHLDTLFIKAAAKITKTGPRSSTPENGIGNLVEAGIINTPDYWLAHYNDLPYLGTLLCALGGAVK